MQSEITQYKQPLCKEYCPGLDVPKNQTDCFEYYLKKIREYYLSFGNVYNKGHRGKGRTASLVTASLHISGRIKT